MRGLDDTGSYISSRTRCGIVFALACCLIQASGSDPCVALKPSTIQTTLRPTTLPIVSDPCVAFKPTTTNPCLAPKPTTSNPCLAPKPTTTTSPNPCLATKPTTLPNLDVRVSEMTGNNVGNPGQTTLPNLQVRVSAASGSSSGQSGFAKMSTASGSMRASSSFRGQSPGPPEKLSAALGSPSATLKPKVIIKKVYKFIEPIHKYVVVTVFPSTTTTTSTAGVDLIEDAAAGTTTLRVSDVSGLSEGMLVTISGGGNSETHGILSVVPDSSRRLSSPRLAVSGTVTVEGQLQHAYAQGAVVTTSTTSTTTSFMTNSTEFLFGVSQPDAAQSFSNPAVIGGIALLSVAALGLVRNFKSSPHVALPTDPSPRTLTSFSRPEPEDVPTLTPREFPEPANHFRYAPVDSPGGFVSVKMDGGRYVEDRTNRRGLQSLDSAMTFPSSTNRFGHR